MKKIIEKIKNLSLETVNKNLLFIALLSLLFRMGSFTKNYIPNPFELIILLVALLTIFDLFKNGKIKDFFTSIPKNIRIALFCLGFSVLFGWAFAAFFLKIPFYFNILLEFGTFIISLGTFHLFFLDLINGMFFIISWVSL